MSEHNLVLDIPRRFMPKQLEVIEAIKNYKYVLYSGAVRAGKTLLLCNIAIRTCIENPGCAGMLGCLTTPQLVDVVVRCFEQELMLYQDALDNAGVPVKLCNITHTKGNIRATFYNGSVIFFKSCEDEVKLRGLTLDFVGLDEPIDIDESAFKQLMNRISGGHVPNPFIILTTNPGSETHWIYKYFFREPTEEHYTVETTTYDNKLLPNYKKYIKDLEDNLDEDWIRRFLNGRWGAYSGQIYKNFSLDRHVGIYKRRDRSIVKGSVVANGDIEYEHFDDIDYFIAGVDFGIRNPSAILTMAVTKGKKVIILEEFYQACTSTDLVAKLSKLHATYRFKHIVVDPAAADVIIQGQRKKLPTMKGDNDVASGIARVKSFIHKDVILVNKSCINTIRELQAYQYEKDRTGKNLTEKPRKKDDHTCISGNSVVHTVNGDIPIKDLVGQTGYVYSYLNGGVVARKFSNVCKTGVKKTLKITFNNGNSLIATNDHQFLLRNGEYCNAEDLSVGVSLMPFNYVIDSHGHVVINNRGNRQFGHRIVYNSVYNHKVAKIEEYKIIDVYNMYVEETNNFACNGIFIHNCDALRYPIFTLRILKTHSSFGWASRQKWTW